MKISSFNTQSFSTQAIDDCLLPSQIIQLLFNKVKNNTNLKDLYKQFATNNHSIALKNITSKGGSKRYAQTFKKVNTLLLNSNERALYDLKKCLSKVLIDTIMYN